MSMAPRSWTALKQPGCTTGCPHADGSAIPGRETWNKTLRSALSICSSFRYWRSWLRLRRTRPRPTSDNRSGLPNATVRGIWRDVRPSSFRMPTPCARNASSCTAVNVPGRKRTSNWPWTMLWPRYPSVGPRQVATRQQQRSSVVRRVAVDRTLPEPFQTGGVDAVHDGAVEVAAHRVDLLAGRGDDSRGGGRGAGEANRPQ